MPIRLAALPLLALTMSALAAEPAPDASLAIYAKPATLVDIGGGRKLNLRCSGDGAPVVLLESGATADSMAWHKVQPAIAKSTKVCAYDRAGFGFSEDGPLPRDLDADAKDLHALIHAAKIATPVVLVGHSLGTNIVRRYAEKYPADVGALVLVDPPPQHISEFSKEWVATDNAMHENVIAFAKMCGKAASAGELAHPKGDAAKCIRPPDPGYPDALNAAIHAQKQKPPFWHTLISEFETNMTIFEEPVSPKESHGATPLIVLVADGSFADAPPDGKSAMEAAQQKTNKLILATSTRSERRVIANSSHDMQFDQPDAIVTAVADAISQSGRRK
ncbi:MAG TPA: alpha/beta hydrolase [Rhodanobacteraceae bacterium]|nr:alpha/beta hydrolase [Rhodanobacteraceae bacterium]